MCNRVIIIVLLFVSLFFAPIVLAKANETPKEEDNGLHSDGQLIWSFDADPAGSLPEGSEVFSGNWVVSPASDAPSPPNILCQKADMPFPALMLGNEEHKAVTISIRFKTISGRTDQAAGILFRIQDRNNYYIVRANALENNVNLYKFVNGRRNLVKESDAKVTLRKWQELRVEVINDQIRAFLDGQLVLAAQDGTFSAGKEGLWTKADSQTCFDDVKVVPQ